MQPIQFKPGLLAVALAALIYCFSIPLVWSQDAVPAPATPAPAPPVTNSATTNSPDAKSTNDLIQLSFQGANIDMVAQWLAETTGKNVIKHPQAQCQVTIFGSKKITRQEAVTTIYHALEAEGFTAIESAQSILIVPADKEPKMSPQMLITGQAAAPGGHEREVRVFTLQFAQANELRDKVKSVLTEKATVDMDEHANALIVTDFHDNVAVAAELIRALDIDRTQDIALRIIPLKNANAADLAKELQPLYGNRDNKDPIQISANDRSNSLMVRSSVANFRVIERVIAGLDTEEAADKVMRSFTLKNADAEDVAKQLQQLDSDQDNSGNGNYRYFYYGGGGNNNNTKKMSVVADRRRNAVVVQAEPARLERVAKMIESLDQPVNDNSLAPKIFVLKYVSAADIEDVLNELFLRKTQTRNYYFFDEDQPDQPDRDVGRLYGKVRITSEPYSNALIVTANSMENLEAVEDVLKQLDVPSEAGDSTFRLGLRFADAQTMANSINILFAKGGSPALRPNGQQNQNNNNNNQQNQQQNQTQQSDSQNNFEITEQTKEEGYYPWIGGQPDVTRPNDTRAQRPVSDLIGRVRIVPDQRSNSLLISANVHFFPQLMKLIAEMDVPTAAVMIEARIVEVSSGVIDQLGVRWSPNTSTFTANDYDNSIIGSTQGSYQKAFGGTQYSGSSNFLGSALSGIRSGMIANNINADVLIQFLKENTGATVLGEPQLEINDNELGKLFVGQQVPTLTGSLTTDVGAQNQSFQYKDVGVILEVQPHINESGDVQLRIRAESSTLVVGQTILGGAVINTRNFRTELTAKTGETLVLGGIIQNQTSDAYRKTPLLGDIPGLKWLFNKKDKSNQRVELLVFLRPRVTRTPEEARILLEDANKRMPLIRDWEKTEAKDDAKMSSKKP
jgi:general secretion pathway protein D